jgi:hypothetical protein
MRAGHPFRQYELCGYVDTRLFSRPPTEPVRVVDQNGEEWWVVGVDAATSLGYQKPHDAVGRHCKGSVKRRVLTAGGAQDEDERDDIHIPDVTGRLQGAAAPFRPS